MNGMKAKAARKRLAAKFDRDGVPKDVNDWTEDDWRDLYFAITEAKAKIATRHGNVCWYCKKKHPPENWCTEKQEAWRKS